MSVGDFAVDKLYEDDEVFAVRDINPRAPVHALIVPRRHIASARDLTAADGVLLAAIFTAANQVATDTGVMDMGYRLTFNVGEYGGQTIFHLHLHLLGGRQMGPEG